MLEAPTKSAGTLLTEFEIKAQIEKGLTLEAASRRKLRAKVKVIVKKLIKAAQGLEEYRDSTRDQVKTIVLRAILNAVGGSSKENNMFVKVFAEHFLNIYDGELKKRNLTPQMIHIMREE